jgi:hypothetical protein
MAKPFMAWTIRINFPDNPNQAQASGVGEKLFPASAPVGWVGAGRATKQPARQRTNTQIKKRLMGKHGKVWLPGCG